MHPSYLAILPLKLILKRLTQRRAGYRAVKFGWGPYGREGVEADHAHVMAAREGMGEEAYLMIDAGTVFGEEVQQAKHRLEVVEALQHILV